MRSWFAIVLLKLIESVSAGVGSYYKEPRPEYGSSEWYLMRYKLQSTTPRLTTDRKEPDELFFGFFPLWSAILFCLTGVCLCISFLGMVCYCLGLRNPRNVYIKEKEISKNLLKQQLEYELDNSNEDYVSMSIMDNLNENSRNLFSSSRLMTVPEYDTQSIYTNKDYEKARKKRFLKDHL